MPRIFKALRAQGRPMATAVSGMFSNYDLSFISFQIVRAFLFF